MPHPEESICSFETGERFRVALFKTPAIRSEVLLKQRPHDCRDLDHTPTAANLTEILFKGRKGTDMHALLNSGRQRNGKLVHVTR